MMSRIKRVAMLLALAVFGLGAGAAQAQTLARNLPTTREADSGVPAHTIYRPANLNNLGFKMPVLLWTNGACNDGNDTFAPFLTRMAAGGFLVIAKGPYAQNTSNGLIESTITGLLGGLGGSGGSGGSGSTLTPTLAAILAGDVSSLLDGSGEDRHEVSITLAQQAMAWAIAENNRPGSKYYHRLDVNRIIPMGQSCGGVVSFQLAARDSRIRSVIVFDSEVEASALDYSGYRPSLEDLHIPLAWINGGVTDPSYLYAGADWPYVQSTTPAYMANHLVAGHLGLWATSLFQDQVATIALNWVDYTLYGNTAAGDYLLNQPCGYCGVQWSTQSKNWANFTPPSAN